MRSRKWACGLRQDVVGCPEADVNTRDIRGRMPLWHAVSRSHEEVVKLLLDAKGIEENSADIDGLTPRSRAAQQLGNENVLRIFRSHSSRQNGLDFQCLPRPVIFW